MMDEYEMLSPSEKKEFQKWMKFHGVYKSMKKQIEGEEDEGYEDEENPMTGASMLAAKPKLIG